MLRCVGVGAASTCCPVSPPAWGRCVRSAPGCAPSSGRQVGSDDSGARGAGAPAGRLDDGCDARSCPVSPGGVRRGAAAAGPPPGSEGGGVCLQGEQVEVTGASADRSRCQLTHNSPLFTSSLPQATASFSCSIFILHDISFHLWNRKQQFVHLRHIQDGRRRSNHRYRQHLRLTISSACSFLSMAWRTLQGTLHVNQCSSTHGDR